MSSATQKTFSSLIKLKNKNKFPEENKHYTKSLNNNKNKFIAKNTSWIDNNNLFIFYTKITKTRRLTELLLLINCLSIGKQANKQWSKKVVCQGIGKEGYGIYRERQRWFIIYMNTTFIINIL